MQALTYPRNAWPERATTPRTRAGYGKLVSPRVQRARSQAHNIDTSRHVVISAMRERPEPAIGIRDAILGILSSACDSQSTAARVG